MYTQYASTSEWSAVRMTIVLLMQKEIWLFSVAIAERKTPLKLICEIFHFVHKVQKNFTF